MTRSHASCTLLAATMLTLGASRPAHADGSTSEAPTASGPSVASEFAVAGGVTAVTAPAVYGTAAAFGKSSNSLGTSALPALLIACVTPALIGTAAIGFERDREGAAPKLWRPFFFGLAAQALVLTAGSFAGAWVRRPSDVVLLSLASGAAVGGAATLGAEVKF